MIVIGSGNGLAPIRCQAITWTNVDLSSLGPLRDRWHFRNSSIWNGRLQNSDNFARPIWLNLEALPGQWWSDIGPIGPKLGRWWHGQVWHLGHIPVDVITTSLLRTNRYAMSFHVIITFSLRYAPAGLHSQRWEKVRTQCHRTRINDSYRYWPEKTSITACSCDFIVQISGDVLYQGNFKCD